MKRAFWGVGLGAAFFAAIGGTVWAERSGSSMAKEKAGAGMAASPVIVELFTSEGCSSCPPADAVLAKLEKQSGTPIIALGFHVDYWNRLGWADPFSNKQFSDRQNEYAQAFQTDSVYTPQMVVDGQAEFVGSDEAQADSAIASAARRPKASVSVALQGGAAGQGKPLSLRADIGVLPSGVKGGEVFAALTESGLSSQVARGENSGRHLSHAAVVRTLVSVGTVGPKGGMLTQGLALTGGSRKENTHIVVFVQDKATHHIIGAAQSNW